MTMDVKRIEKYDDRVSLIRFVAMYSIVACHIFQYFNHELAYWFNTGVQIFLFISGWLYAAKKVDNPILFMKKTLSKLFSDYYIFLLIVVPMYFIFAPKEIGIVQTVKLFLLRPQVFGLNHLWFMVYIVICYMLLPGIYKITNKFCDSIGKEIFLLMILCFASHCVGIVVGMESAWINCFLIGYFMNRLVRLYNVRLIYLLNFVSPLMLVTNLYRVSSGAENNIVIVYSKVFLAVFLFLLFYITTKQMFDRGQRFTRILRWTDRYSYDVYLVHHIFIIGPFSVFAIVNNKYFALLIILCVVHICAVGLNRLSYRIMLLLKNK